MCRQCLCSFVVATSALAAGPCFADHALDTYPFWDGNVTSGWLRVAQSFAGQGDHNVLDNYMFGFSGIDVAIDFEVFEWDEASGPVGDALYSVGLVASAEPPTGVAQNCMNLHVNHKASSALTPLTACEGRCSSRYWKQRRARIFQILES